MAKDAVRTEVPAPPFPPRLIGHLGLWLSLAGCAACLALIIVGAAQGDKGGGLLLGGLLFAPVAGLGVALFCDFIRLPDWTVAPDVPFGLKMLGHLGRVLGSLAAAACIALTILTIVFPDSVPPLPAQRAGEALAQPRPGLAAVYVAGFFISLLVRWLGSAVAEVHRWARPACLIAAGAAVALLAVALVFNLTKWKIEVATLPLSLFLGICALMFVFLLVYFSLPQVSRTFESQRL